jgi:transposase
LFENNETKCPTCGIIAKTHDQIYSAFGFRNMKDSHGKIKSRPQSLCRICRNNHRKNKLKIKHQLVTKKPNKPSKKGVLYNLDDMANFTDDWNSGMSLIDLAKKYNFSYPEKAKRIALQLGLSTENRPQINQSFNIDIEKFTFDWNDGMSLVDLTRKYNLGYAGKAKRIGNSLGLKKQKNLTFFDKFLKNSKKVDELVTMYGDLSITVSQITTHFGFVDNGYVSRLINKIGIPLRIGGPGGIDKFEESKSEFSKMWNDGVSVKLITEKLGISKITVTSWRHKLDLEPRPAFFGRPDSVSDKVEQVLLENHGALTASELKQILKKNILQIGDSYKLKRFQKLPLTLFITGKSARSPTDYFDDYTGQSIIFLYGMYDSLILKLSKILKTSRMYKNNTLRAKNFNFMISRLSQSDKEIKNFEQQLYDAIHDKNNQNKLQNLISVQLQKYTVKQKIHEPIPETKSTNSLIQEIIDDVPKSKFYGHKFESESVLNELDSSYPDQQKRLVQEIFTPFNFICTSLDGEYFDLEIKSNNQFFIKLMIHQQITETALKIFQNKLQGKNGVIINFEEISDSVLKTLPENIYIFNKNDLFSLLDKIEFLPINPKSFAKIMFGENKGEIIFCESVDFETNLATTTNSTQKIEYVLMKFLKHIELPLDITLVDYFNLIDHFKNISILDNFSTMAECIVNVTSVQNKRKFIIMSATVDSNITEICFPVNFFNDFFDDTRYVTASGMLRNKLIQCDCLAWLSQDNIILCKHSIALLFNLWKKNSINSDNLITRKIIDNFLNNINLLINYSIKIEEFWYQKIDGKNPNYELIHYAICNLVSDDDSKITSFFHDCDKHEKIELEKLISEYKYENVKLFESVKLLPSINKKLILDLLFYQFNEQFPNYSIKKKS